MENVKKRYGLWTGMAMVIGIVIGSGVFLKAGGVLKLAGGDLKIALLAWFVGGAIMITSGFCFAIFATRVTKYNGVVDYVEVASGKKVGYFLAWTMTSFYYPIVASVVALFAGLYFFRMLGLNISLTDWQNFVFAFIILTLAVVLNYFSPALSAKFQVSAMVIKLVPILFIAILGIVSSFVSSDYGLINAFTTKGVAPNGEAYVMNFGEAVKKTAFAYEGWVCATSINAELKESKKNLPRSLVLGTILILAFYLIYYISLSVNLGNSRCILEDDNAPIAVFQKIFGSIGGGIFALFIMISCLGTVNGVSISCCRGMYTLSCRGQGIKPEVFSKIKENRSVSLASCLFGYFSMLLMLVIWYLAMHNIAFFGHLGAMDEIICAIIYAIYIAMYLYIMINFKDLGIISRFVLPICGIIGSLFFTICGTGLYQLIIYHDSSSLVDFLVFLGVFIVIVAPSIFFYKKEEVRLNKETE